MCGILGKVQSGCSLWLIILPTLKLAYQKNFTTECNQLAYLEVSKCCTLEDDVRAQTAAAPDVVHSVSSLEQWIGEHSSCAAGELNVYGLLVANSSLYK